eukprot:scaffold1880_cov166-Amphora_coffeaeformis.AAC.2
MDENWILQQLKARNNRETTPFLLIQEAYDRLLLQVDTLQTRLDASERENSALQQQIDELSTSPGTKGSSGGAYSAAIKNEARVRDKLEKLQEEYNNKLKEEANEKETVLKLTKELSELKDQNTANVATIANLKEENARAEKTIEHLTHEYNEATSRADLAEKQYEGLKMTIRNLQKENDELQKENRQLENRVVTEKSKLLQEMSSMTELVEALKKERDMLRSLQKQDTKKTSWFAGGFALDMQPTDGQPATTTIEEEDPSRKFGDMKVVIPTAQKFSFAAHSPEGVCVRYDTGSNRSGTDLVVSSGSDATVKVWDTANGILKSTFRGSAGHPFLGCDIAGHLVAGGSTDKTCRIWTLKTDRMMHHLVGHQHKITAVRFCGSGEAIVTASADRSLKVWDISRTTYKQLVTLRHGSTCNCVDVGSNSFSAVSGHQNGGLFCWDLRTGDRTTECKDIHEGGITSVQFSPVDATKVLTNGMDSTLNIIDLRTGDAVETFRDNDLSTVQTWSKAVWSPNGRYVAAGSNSDGVLLVWNVLTGALSKVFTNPKENDNSDDFVVHTGICGVDWGRGGSSGQQVATLDRRGNLVLWA